MEHSRSDSIDGDPAIHQPLVKHTSEGFLTVDRTGTIIFANSSTEEILGYSPPELVDKPVTTIIPDRLEEDHQEAFSEYLETGEQSMEWEGNEYSALHQNGSEVPLQISFHEHGVNDERVISAIFQ